MPSVQPPDRAPGTAPIFAALGDPTRLALVAKLADGNARSISALSVDSELTRQGVTKHLRVLEEAGLVARARSGRETRYTLRAERIDEARAYLRDVAEQWDRALERLRAFVEGP